MQKRFLSIHFTFYPVADDRETIARRINTSKICHLAGYVREQLKRFFLSHTDTL